MMMEVTPAEELEMRQEVFKKLRPGVLCSYWSNLDRFAGQKFFLVSDIISKTEIKGIELTSEVREAMINGTACPQITVSINEIHCLNIRG